MAALNFDATQVQPAEGFELIPAGNYLVLIEDSEIVQTKAGTGHMLSLKLAIVDGPYKGRKLFKRINVQNQNSQAQDIGQRELSQLCHAVGRLQVADSSELHMVPVIARVVVAPDKSGQYGDRNEIKEFKSASGAAAPATTTTAPAYQAPRPASTAPIPPKAAPAAGNSSKPAWAR